MTTEPCARPGCGHRHVGESRRADGEPGSFLAVPLHACPACPCPGYRSPEVQAAMERLRPDFAGTAADWRRWYAEQSQVVRAVYDDARALSVRRATGRVTPSAPPTTAGPDSLRARDARPRDGSGSARPRPGSRHDPAGGDPVGSPASGRSGLLPVRSARADVVHRAESHIRAEARRPCDPRRAVPAPCAPGLGDALPAPASRMGAGPRGLF